MSEIRKKDKKSEVLFWSIAFPGFGQLLNRRYFKAFLLVILEFVINVKGNVNVVIIHSFLGEMQAAIDQADYAWLMFYPCIYLFAIWDAYRDAGGGDQPFIYIPFVFAAYFGTIGVIYSSIFTVFGYSIGPIFLSIIGMIIGYGIGLLIKRFIHIKKA